MNQKNKKKLKKYRKWLIKNKVFFEVFSFLFLGLASLSVGYFNYLTSQGQLEVLRLGQNPIINIKREFSGGYEVLNIDNVGHHLFDLNISYDTYFKIKDYSDSIITNPTDFYFSINDYYNFDYKTDNTIGRIARINSSDNIGKESERIYLECRELFGKNFQSSSFEHILKITYKDVNKKTQMKYFIIDSFSAIEISKNKFDRINEIIKHHKLFGNDFLTKITGLNIYKDIRKIYNDVIPILEKHEQH